MKCDTGVPASKAKPQLKGGADDSSPPAEADAAKAARTEFANDLAGMSDADIAQEIIIEENNLAETESWLEALRAEQDHRERVAGGGS